MKIVEKSYAWNTKLSARKKTTRIILHHAACAKCTAEQIDAWHKGKGWSGIGYHFFVRKDGTIYRGRPENAVGAHAYNSNHDSLGVCFEGNYDTERTMPDAQLDAGIELVAYLKGKYNITKVQKHKDVCATDCPGRFFPFSELATATAHKKRVDVSDYPVIRIGCSGNYVRTAQRILKITDDGIFGKKTDKAVRGFQKKHKMAVDGIIGPATWDKLVNG